MLYTMLLMLVCALSSQAVLRQCIELPRCCEDIQRLGQETGIYSIYPDGFMEPSYYKVRCDIDTDPGGWTVIQRRVSNTIEFYRTWKEYRFGFGNLEDNFWLGNELIHRISSSGSYELRIDMSNNQNEKRYAIYDDFMVSNAADNYRLTIGNYSGNAGDSLAIHNGQAFSTKDVDNDRSPTNCAVSYKGAWWYNECHWANLNGEYGNNNFGEGINWYTWEDHRKSLRTVEMKIRKRYFTNTVGKRQ